MNSFRELLPQDASMHDALEACCAAHQISEAHVELQGVLHRVTLAVEPGAEPLGLEGPLYLVQGQVEITDGHVASVFGMVSWADRGQARVAAGMIKNADLLAVSAVLIPLEEPKEAPLPTPAHTARIQSRSKANADKPRELLEKTKETQPEASKTENKRPKSTVSSVAPELRKTDVDLESEMALLTPAPAPAPAKTATGAGGWGAAVAASKAAQASPRARAAFRPDDLGFDIDDGPSEWLPGDILLHPQFGRCRVMAASKGSKVKVRRESGGYIDLVLSVFYCTRQPDENNARVYSLRKK